MSLFPSGVIVDGTDLVGREATVRRWMTWLHGGQSIVVAGPRRMGKSSVAHETLRRLEGVAGLRTFAFDCGAFDTEDAFARAVVDAVLERETGLPGVLGRIGQMLRGVEPFIVLSDHATEVALHIGRTPPGHVMVTEAVEALASSRAPAGVLRTAVLLDEFQAAAAWSPATLGRFRSALQQSAGVSVLFLGSQAHTLRALFGQSGQPFYGSAEREHLDPASPGLWVEYLTQRSGGTGVAIGFDEAVELVRRTGAHPYETMRVANHVVVRALLRHASQASLADVAAAYEATLAETADLWQERWRSAGRYSLAHHVLRQVAHGRGPYTGHRGQATAIGRVLRGMEDEGWLAQPAPRTWAFVEPLFGEFVRRLPG